MIGENELPEQIFELSIWKIQEFTKISHKIKNVLNFMHNQELIYLNASKIYLLLSLNLKSMI